MKYILGVLFGLLIFSANGLAQQTKHHSQFPLNCSECHLCKNPTAAKPCLKICPSFERKNLTVLHSIDESPKILIIDTLANRYTPVVFQHRTHAAMALMDGGCASCHHHNPPGKILACSACHVKGVKDKKLDRPSLKGAYHQLCVSCHRQWNDTWEKRSNCSTTCHQKAQPNFNAKQALQKITDLYPTPKRPEKFVLKSDYEEAPIVTFHHNAHVQAYGLQCQDCHKKVSCSECHSTAKQAQPVQVSLSHDNCSACHEQAIDEQCSFCHGQKEKTAFNHAQTGWPLKPFHKKLTCNHCHKHGFSRLSTQCKTCHNTNRWQPGEFDHAVTGLVLDENHQETDCEECHLNRNFGKKPQCSDCHDDKSFPKDVPGKLIKR